MAEDKDNNPLEETATFVKGLGGIAAHIIGYKTLRAFVETIRETTYARRFLNYIHPQEGPDRARFGTRYVSDIYSEIRKSHPSYTISLTSGEKARISTIANTLVSDLDEIELQFIERVVKRTNRVYYDTYHDDKAQLAAAYKEIVEIDYNHSRSIRFILSEEIKNMDAAREKVILSRGTKPGVLILNDTITMKGASKHLMKRSLSEDVYGHTPQELKKIEREFRRLNIPKPSEYSVFPKAPLINIDPTTMIVEPKDRMVELGDIKPVFSKPMVMDNIRGLIAELRSHNADSRALAFFKVLPDILKGELTSRGIEEHAIRYDVITGANGLLSVKITVNIPTGEPTTLVRQTKKPLQFTIPVSRGNVVTVDGTAWRLLESRDLGGLISRFSTPRKGDYYSTVLSNLQKQFGSTAFGQYIPGDYHGAQRRITKLVQDPLMDHIELQTNQPILNVRHVGIDLEQQVGAGIFHEGLAPKRVVLGRIKAMQDLRTFLLSTKGKANLPNKYMVIDFEAFPSTIKSTGKPIIHQVTVAMIEDGEIVDIIARDINPHSPQYMKENFKYDYPTGDLTLTYKGWKRDQVIERLGNAKNFDQVQDEIVEWVQSHTGGKRIPIMAYGANFEKEMIRQNFRKFNSLYTDWIDPMEFHRAINPSLRASHSQANVGLRMELLERDPISLTPRVSTEMLLALKNHPRELMALEKSGDKQAAKLANAIRLADVKTIKELAASLHTATFDVILTNKIAVETMRAMQGQEYQILEDLNRTLKSISRSFRGRTNPITMAMIAMHGPGDYRSVSTAGLLAGKFSKFDLTDLGPMMELGIDPTRPLLQRFAGARLLTGRRPVITTSVYDRIADRYGEVFTDILVGSIKSPLTEADSSLIDVKALSKMNAMGYSYKLRIPNNKDLKIHATLKSIIETLSETPPDQQQSVMDRARKLLSESFSGKVGTYGDLIPPNTVLAEFEKERYRTKKSLYSIFENIAYHEPSNEFILTFNTIDKLGYRSAPVKLIGQHKSVASVTRGLEGVDMIANLNLAKRTRSDAAMLYINTIAKNLEMLYQYDIARKSPEMDALIQKFSDTVKRTLDISIRPIKGDRLRFRYDTLAKDLPYIEKQRLIANAEKFVRGGWTSVVKEFATEIMMLKNKLGIRTPRGAPAEMFWTEKSIEQTLQREYNFINRGKNKRPWGNLSRTEKEAFRLELEDDLLRALETNELGSSMTDKQRELVTRLSIGSPRLIQPYNGQVMSLFWTQQARAFEHSENFNKGTYVKIPALDALVVEGNLAKDILRTRTPVQQDLLEFYQTAYPTFQYGKQPDLSKYPVLNATQIKLPDVQKDYKELRKILSNNNLSMVYIPEANVFYDEKTGKGLPSHLIDTKTGELKPGYTKQPVSPGRYMNTETMSELFGYTPRFVEFEMGKYRTYVPVPGLQQVSAAAAPPKVIPGSKMWSIIQKEHQTYYHLKLIHDAYKTAEAAGKLSVMENALKGFQTKLDSYYSLMLSNKSVFMDLLNPKIAGVEGKVSAVFYPGMDTAIGSSSKKLISGFDVSKVSLEEMGNRVFNEVMESHKLPDGTYIGASGRNKRYKTRGEFRRAILDEGELLLGSLIRRPAENALAWDERLISIDKHHKMGIGMHFDDMMKRHFDADGDVAAWIRNVRSRDDLEKHIGDVVKERLRERRADRKIAQRVRKFHASVMEYETIRDITEKQSRFNDLLKELTSIRQMSGKFKVTAEGIFVREPLKETAQMSAREKIRQGYGDVFALYKMNLSQFTRKEEKRVGGKKILVPLQEDLDLQLDAAKAFETTAKQSYEGFLAQLSTKTSAGFVYSPGHFTRLAIQGSNDPSAQHLKGLLDDFYGMVTQMKKFPGRDAEDIVRAMMHPDLPSSSHIIGNVMSDKFLSQGIDPIEGIKKIQASVRNLKMSLGNDMARTSIRMAIRSVPLTPDMNQIFFEGYPKKMEMATERELFFGKPPILSKLKTGNARIGGIGAPIALALTGLLFSRPDIEPQQDYILPRSMNMTAPQFPARTHIYRTDKPRTKRVDTQHHLPTAGFYSSPYPIVTDRIVDLTNRF